VEHNVGKSIVKGGGGDGRRREAVVEDEEQEDFQTVARAENL